MRPPRMLFAFVSLVVLAAAVLLAIWLGQRHLMYFPSREVLSPVALGLTGVEEVTFSGADTPVLHAWFVSNARAPRVTVIVFNGNAGNRSHRADLATAFRTLGLSVLLFDYRGYGDNDGAPSETGLAADARAARAYLASRPDVDGGRVIYFGESLGSAVATKLAAEQPQAALILRSPFNTIAEVGRIHYPWLPVGWLLRDRFASADYIQRVRCPLLVIAGDRDAIVPFPQSQKLFDAAADPKTLVVIKGADHNDEALLSGPEMMRTIERFLRQLN